MCHPLQDFEGLLDVSLKKMCTPAGVADGKVSPPSRPLSISWPAPLPTNLASESISPHALRDPFRMGGADGSSRASSREFQEPNLRWAQDQPETYENEPIAEDRADHVPAQ